MTVFDATRPLHSPITQRTHKKEFEVRTYILYYTCIQLHKPHLFLDSGVKESDVHLFRQDKVFDLSQQLRALRDASHPVPQPLELSAPHNVHIHLVPGTGRLGQGGGSISQLYAKCEKLIQLNNNPRNSFLNSNFPPDDEVLSFESF